MSHLIHQQMIQLSRRSHILVLCFCAITFSFLCDGWLYIQSLIGRRRQEAITGLNAPQISSWIVSQNVRLTRARLTSLEQRPPINSGCGLNGVNVWASPRAVQGPECWASSGRMEGQHVALCLHVYDLQVSKKGPSLKISSCNALFTALEAALFVRNSPKIIFSDI